MDYQKKLRYARQIIVPEIGEDNQKNLMRSKVLVVGAGGLGSPALLYLASSGVGCKSENGYIGICDDDKLEISNLQRQIIHETSDVGRNKTESAKDTISDLNPDIDIKTHPFKLTKDNAAELIKNYEIVIDGSDNYETRFIISDECLRQKKPLISAAILRFDGQIAAFRPWLSSTSPCYRCLYESEPPEGTMPTCSTNGILAPIAGIMGSLQALYTIKIITGNDDGLDGFLTVFDGKKNEFRKVKLRKDGNCSCA